MLNSLQAAKLPSTRPLGAFTTANSPWGAHRIWLPCFAPYDEMYRIPMIVRQPSNITAGTKSNRLVQFHDLAIHSWMSRAHGLCRIATASLCPR